MASTEKAELFWRSVAFSFAVGFQHMKIPISRNLRATEIGRIIRMRSGDQHPRMLLRHHGLQWRKHAK
ncbi:hypothetical protein AM231_16090 [Paenibacillus solani]|uniref:Uncharacterized protein n=1 Tax=Paenibacillus solani TaxID=1705565 RepID=A0A0M1P7N8_9BACL|nr:hypothetical protein AM231_16090 [Paenibacillus solani]